MYKIYSFSCFGRTHGFLFDVWMVPSFRELIPILFSTDAVESLKTYMRSLGFWGPLFAIFLMVLHSVVFVPSEIIFFANIYIYGFALGLLYTWIGSMLGAYLSFYLARLFGKPLVEKFVSIEKHEKFDRWFQKNGTFGLFILRLIPLFSFNLLNYGAGIVSITFLQFTWSTALGIIPPNDGDGLVVYKLATNKLGAYHFIRFDR